MSATMVILASLVGVVVWLAAAWSTVLLLARTWSRHHLAARSRTMMITAVVDAVALLAVVRAMSPPPGLFSWLWVLACAAVGVGVTGAVRRWPALPTHKPARDGSAPRHPRRQIVLTIGYAVIGAGIIAVVA